MGECVFSLFSSNIIYLHTARIHHNLDTTAKASRGEIGGELCLHNTVVAVRARDAAPDNADLPSQSALLCAVHVCYPLAQIEGDVLDRLER